LRAATSLGRLLARAGRQSEAQQTLGEVYSRFAEGFDTTDIKDAKALLDQLAT
jgi:predicted ATPase